jgi:hypothetical protein
MSFNVGKGARKGEIAAVDENILEDISMTAS